MVYLYWLRQPQIQSFLFCLFMLVTTATRQPFIESFLYLKRISTGYEPQSSHSLNHFCIYTGYSGHKAAIYSVIPVLLIHLLVTTATKQPFSQSFRYCFFMLVTSATQQQFTQSLVYCLSVGYSSHKAIIRSVIFACIVYNWL